MGQSLAIGRCSRGGIACKIMALSDVLSNLIDFGVDWGWVQNDTLRILIIALAIPFMKFSLRHGLRCTKMTQKSNF